MYPAVANASLRTVTTHVKDYIRSLPQFAVTPPDDLARELDEWRRRGFKILSLDFSGLDKSVTTSNYHRVIDAWDAISPEPERMALYRDFAMNMSAVAPGWSSVEDLLQYFKDGGIASGFGGTTIDNCGISAQAVGDAVAMSMKWEVSTVYRRHMRDWRAWHWGDDSILALPPSANEDVMVARLAQVGLTAKLETAPVFLMVAYPANGQPTNLVSRSYMQSVWREHNSRFESVALFGLYVRLSLATKHPMFPALWEAIVAAAAPDALLLRRGVRSFRHLVDLIESADFIRELRKDLEGDVNEFNAFVEGASRGGDPSAPGYRLIMAMLGESMMTRLTWKGSAELASTGTLDDLKISLDVYTRRVEKKAAMKQAEGLNHPLVDEVDDNEADNAVE
jgi:hypothetical protein